jgi:hypothetical protein
LSTPTLSYSYLPSLPFLWGLHQLRNCIALSLLHKNHR